MATGRGSPASRSGQSHCPSLFGFISLGLFYSAWVGSAFIVPACLGAFFVSGFRVWQPLAALFSYYAFRMVKPREPWPAFHDYCRKRIAQARYFRRQELVVQGGPVEPNSKVLLAFVPHGILCCGWALNGSQGMQLAESDLSWMGASSLFSLPVISDVLTWYHGIPASRDAMQERMARGDNLALVPGGFEEATYYSYGKYLMFAKDTSGRPRAGFIKYCLLNGYSIRPVYTFGEERCYWAFTPLLWLRLLINKFKIPAVLFLGQFGILPFANVDLITVVGPPLRLPRVDKPDRQTVELWHARFVAAVKDLFDKNKGDYAVGGNNAKLNIIGWEDFKLDSAAFDAKRKEKGT